MRNRKPHYIRKPIKEMAMFERLDMAQSIADSCPFKMNAKEKSWYVACIVNAMNKMERPNPDPSPEEGR